MKRSIITLHKRKLLPILGLLAVVGIVGGVFAVNQDNAFFNNLFNLGYLEAEYTETFVSPPDWKTCQEVPKTVVTTNNGPSNFKVRLSYDEFWRNAADTENLPLIRDGETLALINFQNEDDWTRHGDWYYYNQEVEPGQSTTSLFKSVTLNCDANMAQDNVCVETSTGQECTAPEDPYEAATYHLDITVQTTTGDFPREDEFYDVTVDPNGGTFQGSAEPYTASLQYGTVLDLSSIAYADHELVGWTINGDEEAEKYTEDSITIDDHITLKANWIWGIYHDVTLNPDGGELDGSTDPIVTSVRHEDSYTIPETEPTRTDYLFDAWTINGIEVSSYTFAVTDDVEIVATWSPVVAKNENTGAFFRSINDANDAASAGDTITLLDDTVENVVITKNITLDLGTHTVVGSLTNNAGSNLTLLNGEINNPEGIAVTNNGTLTLGIDDYKPDGTVDIKADYVRLIGTTTGLKQNGAFYYYDGFIEGDIALDGGYDGSPFYRNTFDDTVVYYFPLVDHNWEKDCQHVELAGSDNAVSKTTVGGDIYYYNLQDNINTSARTGYKIYAVRDFDAGYSITSAANTNVVFDICGFNITINDTITINGTFTIEDSETVVSTMNVEDNSIALPNIANNVFVTPHDDNTTTTITYGGLISVPQTIINNNNLIINNARITGTTANDTIKNYATLTMNGGALGATTGYTMQPVAGAVYAMDKNSYLHSTSANRTAIYTTLEDFTWNNDGNIYGDYYGIQASSNKVTIKNGVIFGKTIGISGTTDLLGGKVKSSAIGTSGNITVDGGSVIVTSSGSKEAVGIANISKSMTATINAGYITVTAQGSGSAYGIANIQPNEPQPYGGVKRVNGGSITATSNSGTAYGIYGYGTSYGSRCGSNCDAKTYFNDGAILATSATGVSYGVYVNGGTGNITQLNGGSIKAVAPNNTSYGARIESNTSISGGRIEGGTYGIYGTTSYTFNIGTNDENVSITRPEIIGGSYALYNGAFNFYDGVLRGEHAYQNNVITATPDATAIHIESSAEYTENCWLTDAENFLSVNGTEYNSLSKAYAAITGESGTIVVIKDASIDSTHPESPTDKTITFDLNGHVLNLLQPIINNSTMTITDSSTEKTGKLHNSNNKSVTITNNKNLNLESGHISSSYRAISNTSGAALYVRGGTITSTVTAIYAEGSSGTGKDVTISITGGEIKVSSITSDTKYGIYGNSYVNTSITGGSIKIEQPADAVSSDTYGIYGGNINLATGTNTAVYINNTNGTAYGVFGSNITLTSGKIEVNSANNTAIGTSGNITVDGGSVIVTSSGSKEAVGIANISKSMTATINAGYITVTAQGSGSAYGIANIQPNEPQPYGGVKRVNGGSITATSNSGTAYGIYGYGTSYGSRCGSNCDAKTYFNDGAILATSATGVSYGVYVNGGTGNITQLNGGSIKAVAPNNTSYGARIESNTSISGGRIEGGTYGIYGTTSYTFNIGTNDENVSITRPEIIGGSYALYNGAFNFYDGVLRGEHAYQDGIIKKVADNTTVFIGDITLDGIRYETSYLVAAHDVAEIGDTKYKKLTDAIEDVQTDETINLIDDNYVFAPITISSEKSFTIKTNGYDIITGNPIVNNGKVTIINNSTTDRPSFDYNGTGYYITNNQNAELILQNLTIAATLGIENKGSLTLQNTTVNSTDISIKNSGGTVNAQNNLAFQASNYAIYNDSGSFTANGITIADGNIYNNSGTITLLNGSSARTSSNTNNYITNNDNMILRTFSANLTTTSLSSNWSATYHARTLYNNGSLTTSSNTVLTHNLAPNGGSISGNSSAVYNDGGGTIEADDTSFILDSTTASSNGSGCYGIYNPSGTVTMRTGTIRILGKSTAYGIWNDTGTVTIGVPEPTTSPHYGRDTADVSLTNPNIQAVGTRTGIGVKNAGGGKVYYYDGKISGSTAALPEKPAGTEYLYEVCKETDTSVTPNLEFTQLFWMRDGQSTCANN